MQGWIAAVGTKTADIERGSPWDNGHIESFHARLRDDLPMAGSCRFHKTALNEFYRVAFRKTVYRSIDELQADRSGRMD